MSGSLLKGLNVFLGLCGMDVMRNVIIVTTMWGKIPQPIAQKQQRELETRWFKEILDHGGRLESFKNNADSAWEIINLVLGLKPSQPLLLEREMRNGASVQNTTAGKLKRGFWSKLMFWK